MDKNVVKFKYVFLDGGDVLNLWVLFCCFLNGFGDVFKTFL